MKTLAIISIVTVVVFFIFLAVSGNKPELLKDEDNNKIPDVIDEEVKKAVAQIKKKRPVKKK